MLKNADIVKGHGGKTHNKSSFLGVISISAETALPQVHRLFSVTLLPKKLRGKHIKKAIITLTYFSEESIFFY